MPMRGSSTDSCQSWQDRRARGSAWLGCTKFHLNRHGGGMWPKNIKNPLFDKEGRLPWTISKIFRGVYTPSYPTLVFQISCDSHHRLRSYCWETARPSIRPNYSVHPVGKTMRWIKKWIAPFLMGTTSSITMQSLVKIAQCAPAVGAKIMGKCVFFCWSRSESGAPCVRGVHSSNTHCVAIYRPISTRFEAFFSKGIALSDTLHSSHIRR